MTITDRRKDKLFAKNLTTLSRVKEVSVKEIVNRTEKPTFETLYWTDSPGKKVDMHTGQFLLKEQAKFENDDYDYLEGIKASTLLETIATAGNLIHKKSFRGPANILVFPEGKLKNIVTTTIFFKANSDKEVEKEALSVVPFTDAKYEGMLYDNRFFSFSSNNLPEDLFLLGRQSEGLKYEIVNKNKAIPEVNVSLVSADYPYKVGDIEYWGFIKVLDLYSE